MAGDDHLAEVEEVEGDTVQLHVVVLLRRLHLLPSVQAGHTVCGMFKILMSSVAEPPPFWRLLPTLHTVQIKNILQQPT